MQEIYFRIEKLICLFLILNPYRNAEQITHQIYVTVIILLFVAKLYKQRANAKIIPLVFAILSAFLQIMTGIKYFYILTTIFALIVFFYPIRHYKLPEVPQKVGYKHFFLPEKYGKLEAIILYPVTNEVSKMKIKWLIESFFMKMYHNNRNKYKVPFPLYKLILSYMHRYVLNFSQGPLKTFDQIIVFSHGRGANIHSYLSILTQLVLDNRIIISVQHSQKLKLSKEEALNQKAFREIEIIKRSSQINLALDFILDIGQLQKLFGSTADIKNPKKIFYMGHSYGGSTVIQAYISCNRKSLINGLVCLDPWLIPIKKENMKFNIGKPLIFIENQIFTKELSIRNSNTEFMETNKKTGIELNLKNADHLHQCDLCFIIGSFLGLVPQHQDNLKFLKINVGIINQFMNNQNKEKAQLQNQIRKNYGDIFV